jgi:hypothetical protein
LNFPRHIAIACLPLVLLLSCGSSNKAPGSAAVPKKAETSGFKPFSQRIDERNGYAVDENGNWVPRNNKRSSFESQGPSPYFSGEYGKKNYKAGEYARKSWWGNKEFGRNSFTGDTDGSRFQSDSGLSGQRAREKGSATGFSGNYEAGSFATGSALGRRHRPRPGILYRPLHHRLARGTRAQHRTIPRAVRPLSAGL